MIYKPGDPVEILIGERWNYGAFIAEAVLRRKLKRGDEYTYTVTAGPSKAWFNVGTSRLRHPTMYPTRRAVWSLQNLFEFKSPKGHVTHEWFPMNLSFESGSWNHALQRIIRIVKSRHKVLMQHANVRVYNYQTGEVIPIDVLHLHADD